jgi:hypothetical protein
MNKNSTQKRTESYTQKFSRFLKIVTPLAAILQNAADLLLAPVTGLPRPQSVLYRSGSAAVFSAHNRQKILVPAFLHIKTTQGTPAGMMRMKAPLCFSEMKN